MRASFRKKTEIPRTLIGSVLQAFEKEYFAFLEINPLVIQNGEAHLLDAAVLVDSAAQFFANGWNAGNIVKQAKKHPREAAVEALAETTPMSAILASSPTARPAASCARRRSFPAPTARRSGPVAANAASAMCWAMTR
jgi:hypothetical protein